MRGEGGKTVGRRLPGALSHLGWSPCTSAISAKRRLQLIPLSGPRCCVIIAMDSLLDDRHTRTDAGRICPPIPYLWNPCTPPLLCSCRHFTLARLPRTLPERTHTRTYLYRTHCTNHTRRCTRRRRSMLDVRHTART